MKIRRIYKNIKPELLLDELKDLIVKQGAIIIEEKMESYSLPDDSSSFITRGILTFTIPPAADKSAKECIRVNIIGSFKNDTKLILDIDEEFFSQDKIESLKEDLSFMLGSYEQRQVG